MSNFSLQKIGAASLNRVDSEDINIKVLSPGNSTLIFYELLKMTPNQRTAKSQHFLKRRMIIGRILKLAILLVRIQFGELSGPSSNK